MILPSSASAYNVFGGTKNIKVGESVKLETEPSTYYTVSGKWSVEGNACTITSRSNRSCTISGIRPGEATVRWTGVVGSADYDYTWYINVSQDSSDGGNNNGGGDNSGGDSSDDENGSTPYDESWSDNYDISWFNKNKDVFVLSTSQELAGVAYLVNNGYTTFKGKTIKLGNDINLFGRNWTSIGVDSSKPFEGTFDGQGHIINGMFICFQNSQQHIYGFFGVFNGVSILNTVFKGEISVNDPTFDKENLYVGGIVGRINNKSTINKCVSEIDIYIHKSSDTNLCNITAGGILGYTNNGCKISYCSHIGNIHVGDYGGKKFNLPVIGGIAGIAYFSEIKMCENYSSKISCHAPSIRGDEYIAEIGGITGSGGDAYYCRSIINTINRGSRDFLCRSELNFV